MAIRSRRLRKKLRVDEFQELGFDVSWRFADSVSEEQIDPLVDRFIDEVIEPRGLGFHGGGHREWEALLPPKELASAPKMTEVQSRHSGKLSQSASWKSLSCTTFGGVNPGRGLA